MRLLNGQPEKPKTYPLSPVFGTCTVSCFLPLGYGSGTAKLPEYPGFWHKEKNEKLLPQDISYGGFLVRNVKRAILECQHG